jgi:hypothetical protein
MPCVHPNINFWQNKIAADQLYQHLLLTAEKKFWRCVESGEPHRLFGAEAPRARIEAIHSASRNAFRHGLAAITRCNPALFPEIERMAEALCGDDKNPFLFEQALTIAENQLVLRCVRARTRRRCQLYEQITSRSENAKCEYQARITTFKGILAERTQRSFRVDHRSRRCQLYEQITSRSENAKCEYQSRITTFKGILAERTQRSFRSTTDLGAASCTSRSRVDRRTRNASISLALQPSKEFWQNEPTARFAGQPPIPDDR